MCNFVHSHLFSAWSIFTIALLPGDLKPYITNSTKILLTHLSSIKDVESGIPERSIQTSQSVFRTKLKNQTSLFGALHAWACKLADLSYGMITLKE